MEECQNPFLDLQPSDNGWDQFFIYHQEMPLVTCDQVAAIIKDAINRRRIGMVPNSRTSSTEAVAGSAPLSQGSSGIMELYGSDVDPPQNPVNFPDNQQEANGSAQAQVDVNIDLVSPDSGLATIRSSRSSKESSVFLSDDSPIAEAAGSHQNFAVGIDSYSPIPECVIIEEETPSSRNNSDTLDLFNFDLAPNIHSESSSHSADYSMADDFFFQSDSSEGQQAVAQKEHNESRFYRDNMANCSASLLQTKVENVSLVEVENISLVEFDDDFMHSPENHEDLCAKNPSVSDIVEYYSPFSSEVIGHAEVKVPPTPMNSLVESSPLDNGPPTFFSDDVIEKINELGSSDISQVKYGYWKNGGDPEALLNVDTWSSSEQESVFPSPESWKGQKPKNNTESRNVASFQLVGPSCYRGNNRDNHDKNTMQENRPFSDSWKSKQPFQEGSNPWCDSSDNFAQCPNETDKSWSGLHGKKHRKYFTEVNDVGEIESDQSSENSPGNTMETKMGEDMLEEKQNSKRATGISNLGISPNCNAFESDTEASTDLRHIQRNLCGWDLYDSNPESSAIDEHIAWEDPFLSYRYLDFTSPTTSKDCMVSPPDTNYSTSDSISSPLFEDDLQEPENLWQEQKAHEHTQDLLPATYEQILNNTSSPSNDVVEDRRSPGFCLSPKKKSEAVVKMQENTTMNNQKVCLNTANNTKHLSSEIDDSLERSPKAASDNVFQFSVASNCSSPFDIVPGDFQSCLFPGTSKNSSPNNLSDNTLRKHEPHLQVNKYDSLDIDFLDDLKSTNIKPSCSDMPQKALKVSDETTVDHQLMFHTSEDEDFGVNINREYEDAWDLQCDTESSSLNTPDELDNSSVTYLPNVNLLNNSLAGIKEGPEAFNTNVDSVIHLSPVTDTSFQTSNDNHENSTQSSCLLSPETLKLHKPSISEKPLLNEMKSVSRKIEIKENHFNHTSLTVEDIVFQDDILFSPHSISESAEIDPKLSSGVVNICTTQDLKLNACYNENNLSGSSLSSSTSPEPAADGWHTTYDDTICASKNRYLPDSKNNVQPYSFSKSNSDTSDNVNAQKISVNTINKVPMNLDIWNTQVCEESEASTSSPESNDILEHSSSLEKDTKNCFQKNLLDLDSTGSTLFDHSESNSTTPDIEDETLEQPLDFVHNFSSVECKAEESSASFDVTQSTLYHNNLLDSSAEDLNDRNVTLLQTLLPDLKNPEQQENEILEYSSFVSQSDTLSQIEQSHWPTRHCNSEDLVTVPSISGDYSSPHHCFEDLSSTENSLNVWTQDTDVNYTSQYDSEDNDLPNICINNQTHNVKEQGQIQALPSYNAAETKTKPSDISNTTEINSTVSSLQDDDLLSVGELEHNSLISSFEHCERLNSASSLHSDFMPDILDDHTLESSPFLCVDPDLWNMMEKNCSNGSLKDSPDVLNSCENSSQASDSPDLCKEYENGQPYRQQLNIWAEHFPRTAVQSDNTNESQCDAWEQDPGPERDIFQSKKLSTSAGNVLEVASNDSKNNSSVNNDSARSVFSVKYNDDLICGGQSPSTRENEYLIRPETSNTMFIDHAVLIRHSEEAENLDQTAETQAQEEDALLNQVLNSNEAGEDEGILNNPICPPGGNIKLCNGKNCVLCKHLLCCLNSVTLTIIGCDRMSTHRVNNIL